MSDVFVLGWGYSILKGMAGWFKKANEFIECRTLRLRLWQCPPFLVLVLGFVTVISMVASYFLASRYVEEPELAALLVIIITVIFFVVGNLIISGFNHLAEANRMKTEFIHIISHQIRTPLSIFKWTLDTLERNLRANLPSDLDTDHSLQTLKDTGEYMIRLVNSLLEASRIEAQTFSVARKPFSLADATRAVIKNYSRYAAASGITLEFNIPSDLPPALGDEERTEMVIQNLLDNAIRYTESSGKVQIFVSADKEFIRWSIKDQGMGIPYFQQKRIFDKFFRAANAEKKDTRGSGLGLFVSKAIVEAQGGKMGFESEEGKGSTFWFTLPTVR